MQICCKIDLFLNTSLLPFRISCSLLHLLLLLDGLLLSSATREKILGDEKQSPYHQGKLTISNETLSESVASKKPCAKKKFLVCFVDHHTSKIFLLRAGVKDTLHLRASFSVLSVFTASDACGARGLSAGCVSAKLAVGPSFLDAVGKLCICNCF